MTVPRIRHQIPVPGMYGDPENERIWCNWDDCGNPASSLHTGVICYAKPAVRGHRSAMPGRPQCPHCSRIAFCSAAHMDMYFRAHRPGQFGTLSPGTNKRFL